jgi:hypothetical protein
MTIVGNYDGLGMDAEPLVEAVVVIPRLGAWGAVKFLIDTGTDRTTLYPGRDNHTHIDYSMLRSSTLRESIGVGGRERYYSERAYLMFRDEGGQAFQWMVDVDIWRPDFNRLAQLLPSLLGRDFLNLCDVRLNHSAGVVALEPVNVDDSGGIVSP